MWDITLHKAKLIDVDLADLHMMTLYNVDHLFVKYHMVA